MMKNARTLIFITISIVLKTLMGDEEEIALSPFMVELGEEALDTETHPAPEGFTHEEYFGGEWEITEPYTLRFSGDYIGNEPVFEFTHNEPIDHSFSGFSLENDVFDPRYVEFEEKVGKKWIKVDLLYCGTGEEGFILKSGVKYRIKMPIWNRDRRSNTQRVILAGWGKLRFYSEPFDVPKILKEARSNQTGDTTSTNTIFKK